MNSQINLSNKKSNFTISSMIKKEKKNASSRSNTQEMPHYNRSKNKSSSCKNKKSKNINNNSLYNNKNVCEEFPKKFTGITDINISAKINSNLNIITTKSEYKNMNENKYKEMLNSKEKKIAEIEQQILLYKDKLKNQIRILNINTSINSFNLSKTRSSTNVTERNMFQVRSLSNSHAKIKTSYPLTRNLYGNKKGEGKQNKNKSKSKKKPKSINYRKPKINNLFFSNKINEKKMHINNFKRSDANSKQKYKNKNIDIFMNYKRAKSSNIEKNKNNKNNSKNIVKGNINYSYINKNKELLTVEQTQILCDRMMEKMKNVLELVKIATTGD